MISGCFGQVTDTKPVSVRVGRLRELLKTKNVTESCPEPPFILREPQDERRAEGDDTGIVAVTVRRNLYSLGKQKEEGYATRYGLGQMQKVQNLRRSLPVRCDPFR